MIRSTFPDLIYIARDARGRAASAGRPSGHHGAIAEAGNSPFWAAADAALADPHRRRVGPLLGAICWRGFVRKKKRQNRP